MDKNALMEFFNCVKGNPEVVVHSDRQSSDFRITGYEKDGGLLVLFIKDDLRESDNSIYI